VQQGAQRNDTTQSTRSGASSPTSTESTNLSLNTEQKTKIRETVINSSSAPRAPLSPILQGALACRGVADGTYRLADDCHNEIPSMHMKPTAAIAAWRQL
jgi:hypothetical protein